MPESTINKYPNSDLVEIQSLMKVVYPTQQQQDAIFNYYKKYVNGSIKEYTINCGNCPTSLPVLFVKLRDWFVSNTHLFANE